MIPSTPDTSTLSLHDALPIYRDHLREHPEGPQAVGGPVMQWNFMSRAPDRKSTRLNSSHLVSSYAVFCLKKKRKNRAAILYTAAEHNEDSDAYWTEWRKQPTS